MKNRKYYDENFKEITLKQFREKRDYDLLIYGNFYFYKNEDNNIIYVKPSSVEQLRKTHQILSGSKNER